MLGLYLLAAHMVGDFLLQTRWQAVGKFTDHRYRLRHVFAYCMPFWPIAAIYGRSPWWHGLAFVMGLYLLHYLTDSRRFLSTIGDAVAWYGGRGNVPIPPDAPLETITVEGIGTKARMADGDGGETIGLVTRWHDDMPSRLFVSLPPNPWPPMPIMIDQSLHVAQLALLGGLLLR